MIKRVKNLELRIKKNELIILVSAFIILHSAFIPSVYAQQIPIPTASIKQEYAFGYIKTLGDGLSILATPMFYIAAVAVVFYFIIGAFKYLTSGGDKNAVASAMNMITHAIIGFVLLMMMFLILQYVPILFGLTGFRIIQ